MNNDVYKCFAELSAKEVDGEDYVVFVRPRDRSRVVVIAPHGGGIEPKTSEIAEKIAGAEFSLYCFSGIKRNGNKRLHITSENFDEPQCIELLKTHSIVLTVHGCKESNEQVFLGGRDKPLICDLTYALRAAGIHADASGRKYRGIDAKNICNRGASAAGAQVELSQAFRDGNNVPAFVKAVRDVLKSWENAMQVAKVSANCILPKAR